MSHKARGANLDTLKPWADLPRELRLKILILRGWDLDMRRYFDIGPGPLRAPPRLELGKLLHRCFPGYGWTAVMELPGGTLVQRTQARHPDNFVETIFRYSTTTGRTECVLRQIR